MHRTPHETKPIHHLPDSLMRPLLHVCLDQANVFCPHSLHSSGVRKCMACTASHLVASAHPRMILYYFGMCFASELAVPPVLVVRMQALERQKQTNALAAPPPDHWLAVPNTSTVYYLPLPFEGGAPPPEPCLDASTVHEMTRQVIMPTMQSTLNDVSAVLGAVIVAMQWQGVPVQAVFSHCLARCRAACAIVPVVQVNGESIGIANLFRFAN